MLFPLVPHTYFFSTEAVIYFLFWPVINFFISFFKTPAHKLSEDKSAQIFSDQENHMTKKFSKNV